MGNSKVTRDQLVTAARHLATSRRGRTAMRDLLKMLTEGGADSLDSANQEAFRTLLDGVWGGPFAGTTKDVMREALGE